MGLAAVVSLHAIGIEKRECLQRMDALKKSTKARGQAKVRDAVRRRVGKDSETSARQQEEEIIPTQHNLGKVEETHRETATRFEELARDTPKSMQLLAEKSIVQTKELYERSKDALEGVGR